MAATNPHAERDQNQPIPRIGRDELNLAEFPIALLADRVPQGQKTLSFEDRHGRLTVTGSDAYGLPTAADADVIIALIYLTKIRNNFSDVKVNFSRYELIKLLNWPDDGRSYKRLGEALHRWVGVSLYYDKCWWNNRLKCYTDAAMHIIETIEIIDSEARGKVHTAGQNGLPLSYFIWNRTFLESCQADNLRQLDLDEYFSLQSAVSKRLYRFLGKRLYLQHDWTFDLKEIAFERVGLSRSYADAYKIKEKLQPAIEELERIGWLRPLSREARYHRIDRGQWTIRFARGSRARIALPEPPKPPDGTEKSTAWNPPAPAAGSPRAQPTPEPPRLVAELAHRGVTRTTAADLVRHHPAERIEAKLEVFDWLMERQDKRVAKSPAGYLVKSISDDYAAPKGFESRAARRARADAKRQADQQAAADRRRQQEQEARDQARRQAVDAYLQGLTPAERTALEAEALARANLEARQAYEAAAPARLRASMLLGLVREYVATELLRGAIPAEG
jgi:Replication initiator protein A